MFRLFPLSYHRRDKMSTSQNSRSVPVAPAKKKMGAISSAAEGHSVSKRLQQELMALMVCIRTAYVSSFETAI